MSTDKVIWVMVGRSEGPKDLTEDISTLVQVIALGCQADSYYLNRTQITKFTGPIWGPPGSCRPQTGPMNLAIREVNLVPGCNVVLLGYIELIIPWWYTKDYLSLCSRASVVYHTDLRSQPYWSDKLTHWGLVTSYVDIDLSQHWLR